MKKIYLFAAASIIATASFAQSNNASAVTETKSMPVNKSITAKTISSKDFAKTNNKSTNTYWLDYTTAYENLYSSTAYGLVGNLLFPDSTILVDYGTSGFSAPWIHGIAQLFDLNAFTFQNEGVNISPTTAFSVDSIQALGVYSRVDNGVTDTLRFRIVAPSAQNLSGLSYFGPTSGVSTNLNPNDTVFMFNLDWNYSTLSTPGVLAEYKLPLDAAFYADSTTNGLHTPTVQTNGDIIPVQSNATFGNKFAIVIDFIPGYSWIANQDTLEYNKNAWFFGSFELNGQNTYPEYDKSDYNLAYILPQDVRYNGAGGWNNSYIPSYAYMGSASSYSYESHAIYPQVTQTLSSVNELNKTTSFSVYPNPSNGIFNINLNTDKAEQLTLTVNNIVGQTVLSKQVRVAGQTNETISLAGYEKGVYFLTISNNSEKQTVKLIVE